MAFLRGCVAALAVACLGAVPAAAQGVPSGAPILTHVSLPGGVAGLLRATDVPGAPDPATAILAFITAAHVLPPKPSPEPATYLGAVTRLAEAVESLPGGAFALPKSGSLSGPAAAIAEAWGVSLVGGKLVPLRGQHTDGRLQLLEASGLPVKDWIARLNAGESVRPAIPSDDIPLPLSAAWWSASILKRAVAGRQVAAAILTDRRAAFTYLGLMSLDDETLAYFGEHPTALGERSAGAFGEWGRSIRIAKGRVQVPGGDAAAAAWQAIVGASPADTVEFLRALMAKDGGRAAYFYDAVAHMDAPHQAFALASALGANRVERVRSLYALVAGTRTILSDGDWPVVRHPFGPLAVVREAAVNPAGELTTPASRAFWDAAIGRSTQACSQIKTGGEAADAAWLSTRIERELLEAREHWVAAVAFGQRVFRNATSADLPAACEAVASFSTHDALLLALEQIGLEQPADFAAVVRFADRIWSGADRKAAVLQTAQVQVVVLVLQEAVRSRSLPRAKARALLLTLAAPASSGGGALPAGGVGRWLSATFLPSACPGQASADACLLRLVSGHGAPVPAARPLVWEDDRYGIDLGAANVVRLERVRAAQKATLVEDALNLFAASAIVAGPMAPDQLARAAAMITSSAAGLHGDLTTLFGHPAGAAVRRQLDDLAASVSRGLSASSRQGTAEMLLELGDIVLADALVSFAYAVAIGDPDDAVLMDGNPARRHRFDSTVGPATEAWHLPEEVQALDKSWLIEGSVISLRTVYARSWLRRLSIHDPGAAVRPDPRDVRVFGESVTAFNPFDLTDETRDAMVAAIERGRLRVRQLAKTPAALWAAARETGVAEWRCRAALAADRGADPTAFFSLAELMWLGEPAAAPEAIDAWGAATRPLDGALGLRMPRRATWEDYQGPRGVGLLASQVADVHLAVAEGLAGMSLPAVLAPGVAAQAVWDVITTARMAHRDDWFALVRTARALPHDRFLDYVSALTAVGPLVPAK